MPSETEVVPGDQLERSVARVRMAIKRGPDTSQEEFHSVVLRSLEAICLELIEQRKQRSPFE